MAATPVGGRDRPPGERLLGVRRQLARVHHFSGDGAVVEDEITEDPATLGLCVAAFESVWERAVPHEAYKI